MFETFGLWKNCVHLDVQDQLLHDPSVRDGVKNYFWLAPLLVTTIEGSTQSIGWTLSSPWWIQHSEMRKNAVHDA